MAACFAVLLCDAMLRQSANAVAWAAMAGLTFAWNVVQDLRRHRTPTPPPAPTLPGTTERPTWGKPGALDAMPAGLAEAGNREGREV